MREAGFIAIYLASVVSLVCTGVPSVAADSVQSQGGLAKPGLNDSANDAQTIKSWTAKTVDIPGQRFLDSLDWHDYPAGVFTLRTGIIYGRWIAAMQFVKNGTAILTEYTPGAEYVCFIDLKSGKECSQVTVFDVNHDGVPEVGFVHKKLDDPNYHMYAVYSLAGTEPKLLWKSGGQLGDWLKEMNKGEAADRWNGSASN